MGSIRNLDRYFTGEVSRRHQEVAVDCSKPLNEGFGHSFYYYIPPYLSKVYPENSAVQFGAITGAFISANICTPLTTTLSDPFLTSSAFDRASSFKSSQSFASVLLQHIRQSSIGSDDCVSTYKDKFCSKNKLISKPNMIMSGVNEVTFTSLADDDYEGDKLFENQNVEWAQGKAGEDRVHVVVCEEHGWVFVGIYDGFSGPDATEFLLCHLYSNIYKELEGLPVCFNSGKGSSGFGSNSSNGVSDAKHSDVLTALSEALKKTEELFLGITDEMIMDNPELALMGSCVMVMLMKGEDVYLMNVGDSRAVLAQKLHMIEEKLNQPNNNSVSGLAASQLTFDHCTSVQEEVERIKSEHLDDSSAIIKNRVKGSLMVTRAFGAGFLKKPKWNNALLEIFRVNYVGDSPYLSCAPWLRHHRLGPKDKFLILSSDGLYQYLTNEEAVAEVEVYKSLFPEGNPAQHLVEEVLFRAAKKAGMKVHELLKIPLGDRRKYHDDVSVVIISFEGRIWHSS